jgi:alkanesulfonate monooxygenase SsuD/methylene tetrahydromethanopterin reductase-like flavin-dependent oxidoreductase (luciferase family)
MMDYPLSVLDLASIGSGSTSTQALRNTTELAQLAERLGYTRFWLAEHHSMPSIASSAPEILIGHVASATERIRVGSGGIMLPNHVPLMLAERFHTLEALHPGRIDLGIGRAPGTDPATVRALRPFDSAQFPEQFPEPHAILAVSVVCAKTDEQADWLARSMDLAWVRLVRGEFGRLPSPEEATAYPYTPQEQAVVRARRAIQFIGSPATVRAGIDALVQETGANEVMVTSMVHSHAERMRSYELLAESVGLRPSP